MKISFLSSLTFCLATRTCAICFHVMTAKQCVGRHHHDIHGQLGGSSTTADRIQYGAMTGGGVPGVVTNVGHIQVTNLHKSVQL